MPVSQYSMYLPVSQCLYQWSLTQSLIAIEEVGQQEGGAVPHVKAIFMTFQVDHILAVLVLGEVEGHVDYHLAIFWKTIVDYIVMQKKILPNLNVLLPKIIQKQKQPI